uniref:Uncharacterized protein n=1 Tax=Knipowitschia caucasica TaxID=637954 RepID=A0AAV2JP48_KNICA
MVNTRREPTTERHGGFDLLRFRPGPVHPSLDDLVVPGSPRSTISIPGLVRTPDQHSPLQLRAPELKRSSSLSLPRHGGFDLLRFRPGPVHPSLDDLVVPGSPRSTILIRNLVRTPDQHSPLQLRAPELKRSSSLSLPVAWITGARHCSRRDRSRAHRTFGLYLRDVIHLHVRCTTASIHRRDPTTERHGGFDLLRFRPGPVHPSLDDLVVPGSPRSTISIPNLVRTPDQHSPLQLRAPELKRSSSLSLPVAWITGARHCSRRPFQSSQDIWALPA